MTRVEPRTVAIGDGGAASPSVSMDVADVRALRDARAERWEQRLAVPVVVAALVSIPAVFLTMADHGALVAAGKALNWISLAMLTGEAVLLLVVSGDRWAWIRRHKWHIGVTIVAIPAVAFALFPAQALRLLRLARLIGALRVRRANTMVKAGRVVARRLGLSGPWRYLPIGVGSVLGAGFVALVLADPTSSSQDLRAIEEVSRWRGTVPILLAGVLLAVSTFIVLRYRNRSDE